MNLFHIGKNIQANVVIFDQNRGNIFFDKDVVSRIPHTLFEYEIFEGDLPGDIGEKTKRLRAIGCTAFRLSKHNMPVFLGHDKAEPENVIVFINARDLNMTDES